MAVMMKRIGMLEAYLLIYEFLKAEALTRCFCLGFGRDSYFRMSSLAVLWNPMRMDGGFIPDEGNDRAGKD